MSVYMVDSQSSVREKIDRSLQYRINTTAASKHSPNETNAVASNVRTVSTTGIATCMDPASNNIYCADERRDPNRANETLAMRDEND